MLIPPLGLKSAPSKQKSITHTEHVISLGRKRSQRSCIFDWKQANIARKTHGWWKRGSIKITRGHGLPTMGIKYKCLSKKTVENVQINSVWGQGIFRVHKMSCSIFFFFTTTDGMLYRMNSKYTMSKIILLLRRAL